ncbi:MAG TPA: hypothetical protein VFM18_11860 [Methanosarcina sp.]|nr:hypothetical protein [Methanosarcina sp.]
MSDLDFNGQAGDGVNRSSYKCSNQSGLEMKENYGNGPRTASALSTKPTKGGKPATKDAYKTAPATAKGK